MKKTIRILDGIALLTVGIFPLCVFVSLIIKIFDQSKFIGTLYFVFFLSAAWVMYRWNKRGLYGKR